jgi:hypothetical protein
VLECASSVARLYHFEAKPNLSRTKSTPCLQSTKQRVSTLNFATMLTLWVCQIEHPLAEFDGACGGVSSCRRW